jgi:2-polyprenyl-6-methoxyphenol hydroxylase-like FAD-dependent oxidoreductase
MNKKSHRLIQHRAVVIGGSMAGLLAARVLADYFSEVTILERDSLPSLPEQRRGVPQGRHAHGIMASGREVLEALFPGISGELIGSGAVSADIVRDSRWFLEGACLRRFSSGLQGVLASRPLLEHTVRERVRRLPNVRLIQDCTVGEIVTTEDRKRVVGVKTPHGFFPADLVIDAAGRASRCPQWLKMIGFDAPAEDRIEIGLGYTTRWFRREPHHLDGDVAAIAPATPDRKRGGVMLAQEGDQWIVTLTTHFQNPAPADLDGFIEFTRTLPARFIYEVIRDAEPVGEAATARFPASIWRRYDKLERFPDGYLVFGDSICSFNPRYGQGMSVAALQAVELQKTLAGGSLNLAFRFFAAAARVIEVAWRIAAGSDLQMPEAQGQRSLGSLVMSWYMTRLLKAAHHDSRVALTFYRVTNLVAPPKSLLRPAIALRVLLRGISHKKAQNSQGPSASPIFQKN